MKVGIGLPAYGGKIGVQHGFMWALYGAFLGNFPELQLAMFDAVDICGVDRARNRLLEIARQKEIDWLIMVDSDVWIDDAGTLHRMIIEAEEKQASIVGPPVIMRGGIKRPMIYEFVALEKNDKGEATKVEGRLAKVCQGGLFEIDAIGGSCIAINCKRTEGCWFRFTDKVSEDLEFCRQVGEIGGRIYCDPRVKTNHVDRNEHVLTYDPKA